MALNDLAGRVLRLHAEQPDKLFYGVEALGSFFRDPDMIRLDRAYEALELPGYLVDSGRDLGMFGERKRRFRITNAGLAHSHAGQAS